MVFIVILVLKESQGLYAINHMILPSPLPIWSKLEAISLCFGRQITYMQVHLKDENHIITQMFAGCVSTYILLLVLHIVVLLVVYSTRTSTIILQHSWPTGSEATNSTNTCIPTLRNAITVPQYIYTQCRPLYNATPCDAYIFMNINKWMWPIEPHMIRFDVE